MSDPTPLETTVAEWSKGLRLLLAVFSVIVCYYSLRGVLHLLPSLDKIFEDMLGDRSRLPPDTLFVLNHRLAIIIGLSAVNFVGVIAIFLVKRPFHVCCVAVGLLVLGVTSIHLLTSSVFSPLRAIVQGLSGGSV